MRNLLPLVFLFILAAPRAVAQTPQCSAQPASPEVLAAVEARLAEVTHSSARTTAPVLYIPVVVHVVYNSAAQNVPDAAVVDYLAELNTAFRKQRVPPFTPRLIFDSLWADMEIQFCLADKDPSGAPTTGITHTQTGTFFGGFAGPVKAASSGGVNPWPVTQYLNIWIAPMGSGGIIGNAVNNNVYANGTETEGIVVSSIFPLVLGNVLAHEAGHFVGLHHTFDNAAELVDDTPWEGTGGHAPLNRHGSSCASGDLDSNTSIAEAAYWAGKNPPDMIENFMGYNRPCQFMFTKGQVARARASVQQFYAGLVEPACAALRVAEVTRSGDEPQLFYEGDGAYVLLRGGRGCAFSVLRADGAVVRRGWMEPGVRMRLDGVGEGVYLVRVGSWVRQVRLR